jgi:hypothetical protein
LSTVPKENEVRKSSQLFQNGSEPELVAKTVLTAINTPNPNPRYLVGKDVEEWVKSKNSMTDTERFVRLKS